jgi:hypothetical protein
MSDKAEAVAAGSPFADSGGQASQKLEHASKNDPHAKNNFFICSILANNKGKLEVSQPISWLLT